MRGSRVAIIRGRKLIKERTDVCRHRSEYFLRLGFARFVPTTADAHFHQILNILSNPTNSAPRDFYDMQQNRNLKLLFTKEGTAVERLESDDKDQVPMFSSSYQDVRRGWSLDPWVGKQIDPAGREPVFTRQESFGCIPAVKYHRAPGYTGYVPGKVSENVVGERQTITDHIAKHRTDKNRAEILQR